MGKGASSAQNDEVASDTAVSHDAAFSPDTASSNDTASTHDAVPPSRQRPEEILAQTLSATAHPEATDGWSSRGRRIFLIAMAAAGVLLVLAGLLVTNELAPGTGSPAPVQTGPGSGLTNQLLETSSGGQGGGPGPSSDIAIPIPATPTTRPSKTLAPSPGPVPPQAPYNQPPNNTQPTTPPTTQPSSPTTTLPCSGLLGQGIQQAVPLPCNAATRSTSTSPLG